MLAYKSQMCFVLFFAAVNHLLPRPSCSKGDHFKSAISRGSGWAMMCFIHHPSNHYWPWVLVQSTDSKSWIFFQTMTWQSISRVWNMFSPFWHLGIVPNKKRGSSYSIMDHHGSSWLEFPAEVETRRMETIKSSAVGTSCRFEGISKDLQYCTCFNSCRLIEGSNCSCLFRYVHLQNSYPPPEKLEKFNQ